MAASSQKIAFVGAGNMARAILKGVLVRGLIPAANVSVSSPSGPSEAIRALGVSCSRDNAQAVAEAGVVILCVKPHFVASAIASFAHALREGAVLVSVAAGVTTTQLEEVGGYRACSSAVHPPPTMQNDVVGVDSSRRR
jgi:pyrroline-5-carboxylate reductase